MKDLDLRVKADGSRMVRIPSSVSNVKEPFRGRIDDVGISRGIIFLPVSTEGRTPAQWTNFLSLTAAGYEDLWRVHSLGILSGGPFSVEKECELLTEALKPTVNGSYLDLGCSTALYARALAKAAPGATVVAVDFSTEMLKRARKKAAAENVNLFLVRADISSLPFEDSSFDGLSMGGTLNELGRSAEAVLAECRRVLTPGGRFFMMHLLRSKTLSGGVFQTLARGGGIRFWSLEESNRMFEVAGFTIVNQSVHGVVCITTLE